MNNSFSYFLTMAFWVTCTLCGCNQITEIDKLKFGTNDSGTDTDKIIDSETNVDNTTDSTIGTDCNSSQCEAAKFCSSGGDVVCINTCGTEILIDDCVDATENGACTNGACSCAPGFTGETCVQACTPTNSGVEICDTIDNDCNGIIDETGNLADDPQNCGACGNNCLTDAALWPSYGSQVPANIASTTCNQGLCEVDQCATGYLDDKVFPYPDCNFFVKQIATGGSHSCVLLSNNTIRCWGLNDDGQLGRNTGVNYHDPRPGSVLKFTLATGVTIQSIAMGKQHSCALLSDSTVQCWGDNFYYQLGRVVGNGTMAESTTFEPGTIEGMLLTAGVNMQSIEASLTHNCALFSDSSIQCWGNNYYGQLGGGESSSSTSPGPVQGLPQTIQIAMLSVYDSGSCAMLSDGSIQCWGNNIYGQLGRNTEAETSSFTPAAVQGLSLETDATAQAISSGEGHTCVLFSDNAIQCWGANNYGQLGRNTGAEAFSFTPEAVQKLSLATGVTVQSIAAGGTHTCALLSDNTIQCWGRNTGTEDYNPIPTVVQKSALPNGVTVQAISAGGSHTCILLSDGTIQCWGDNSAGQLGTILPADATFTHVPVTVENVFQSKKLPQ